MASKGADDPAACGCSSVITDHPRIWCLNDIDRDHGVEDDQQVGRNVEGCSQGAPLAHSATSRHFDTGLTAMVERFSLPLVIFGMFQAVCTYEHRSSFI